MTPRRRKGREVMFDGRVVRKLREERGLTLTVLAEKAGLTLSWAHKLEKGKSADLRISTLKGIARALGLSVVELLEIETSSRGIPGGGGKS